MTDKALTSDAVREALATVNYPGFSRDIVSFGLVKDIQIDDNDIVVQISLATADPEIPRTIDKEARAVLEALPGAGAVKLDFDIKSPPQAEAGAAAAGMPPRAAIPGAKKVIAIASGKGGVGKSTVSTNLAAALAAKGARTGICDCDLYGPSIALMMGASERPNATEDNRIIPVMRHGLQIMSMGLLLENDSPVIVRGPLATRYTQQFLQQVAWDDLDYLILDLPPGTGDIQLTIVQTVALDGAVIVTTPQEVALIDARKASAMFERVNVPVLGIIENMSYFRCPGDAKRYDIFGTGGGAKEAERLGVPLLAEIPIDIDARKAGDEGRPIALASPDENTASRAFHDAAKRIASLVPA